ncbi:MAG: hypothetical protein ACP6IY_20485 [Promethearchaeia archaeon]
MFKPFPYVYSKKYSESQIYLIDLIFFIQIILNRINFEKKKYRENLGKDPKECFKYLQYLKLDVRSLYIFSTSFLDYLINYISNSFFQNYLKSGLKNNSFRNHIKSLRKIEGSDKLFNEYKDYILAKEQILELRIINIRDKMIIHRHIDTNEFWGYDVNTNIFYIYFTKQKDFYKIENDVKTNVQSLVQKYHILKNHKSNNISEFIYYNSLIEKLESIPIILEKNDRNKLIKSRFKLGIIINGEDVYKLLYNFSEGLCRILNKNDLKYFPNLMDQF